MGRNVKYPGRHQHSPPPTHTHPINFVCLTCDPCADRSPAGIGPPSTILATRSRCDHSPTDGLFYLNPTKCSSILINKIRSRLHDSCELTMNESMIWSFVIMAFKETEQGIVVEVTLGLLLH